MFPLTAPRRLGWRRWDIFLNRLAERVVIKRCSVRELIITGDFFFSWMLDFRSVSRVCGSNKNHSPRWIGSFSFLYFEEKLESNSSNTSRLVARFAVFYTQLVVCLKKKKQKNTSVMPFHKFESICTVFFSFQNSISILIIYPGQWCFLKRKQTQPLHLYY